MEVRSHCWEISIRPRSDIDLTELIMAEARVSMDIEIRLLEGSKNVSTIRISRTDRSPAPNNYLFVHGQEIWATYLKGWVMELLAEKRIDFSCRHIPNPPLVLEALDALSPGYS